MRRKKGVSPMLMEILYVLVAAFVLVGIYKAGQKIGAIGIQSREAVDWASTQNLYQLSYTINSYSKVDTKFYETSEVFSFSEKYVIVGFSATDKYIYTDCYSGWNWGMEAERITKPKQCGNNACLCMWEDTARYDFDEDDDNTVHSCYVLPDVNYIVSYYCGFDTDECETNDNKRMWQNLKGHTKNVDYSEAIAYAEGVWDGKYAPFILYGECEHFSSAKEFHGANLYIEKVTQNGKNTIFIFPEKFDHIQKRRKTLKDKFDGEVVVNTKKLQDSLREGDTKPALKLIADLYKNKEGKKHLINEIEKIDKAFLENKVWFEDGTDYGEYYFSLLDKKSMVKYLLDEIDDSTQDLNKIERNFDMIFRDIENIFVERIDRLVEQSSDDSLVNAVEKLYEQRDQNVIMKGVLADKVRYITKKLMDKRDSINQNGLLNAAIEYMILVYPPATDTDMEDEVRFLEGLLDESPE